ncbi:hypothetical protein AMTRI_Chr01g131550 [Amborella trichopoda]|uniref:EF-hand domain-containing protein n=1 Tax=Amborella trichopoda TaxID=13333 RepID=W1P593_AMBTC|nr:probable calcium-binding protein CML18 [Amborella trichopoda]ERN05072.1 hypothetical protein AMTR_s00053p00122010 [Amborella trichopoda]|eukprot:XP_006843397.1 probable calcium-binding protein CML18 [Amborella trichopoda]
MKFTVLPIFRLKKSPSLSKSDPLSFGSNTSSTSSSSSDSSTSLKEAPTPKSVLPPNTFSPKSGRKTAEVHRKTASKRYTGSDKRSDLEIEEIYDTCRILELVGDGKISKEDVGPVFRALGVEPPSYEELRNVATDDEGRISLEDLARFGAPASAEEPVSELMEAFGVFDRDGDGRISAEELQGVLSALGDAECTVGDCHRMIRGFDSDGDGFVCFQDFARMMTMHQTSS